MGLVALLLLLPWLVARDALRGPASRWDAIGRPRWLWVALIVLVPVAGPLLYLRIARPELRAAS